MRVLEVGCGVGTNAFELANFADVFVVGIDSDRSKVEKATSLASKRQLSNRVTFIHMPYSELCSSFQRASFDAIYAIESLKSAPAFNTIYASLAYLLRLGCKLAMYEWCWTQALNPHDVDHCRLAELIEASTQIGHRPVAERSFSCAVSALESSRLQIICQEDLASRGGVAYIPWYSFLDSAVRNSAILWPLQIGGDGVFGGLTKNAAVVLSQAGHLQLFTPMAMFVAKQL